MGPLIFGCGESIRMRNGRKSIMFPQTPHRLSQAGVQYLRHRTWTEYIEVQHLYLVLWFD